MSNTKVVITGVSARENSKDNSTFYVANITQFRLDGTELVPDPEIQQNASGGMQIRPRATTMPLVGVATQAEAEKYIGTHFDGTIERKTCEPYQVLDRVSGQLVELSMRWTFVPASAKGIVKTSDIQAQMRAPVATPEQVFAEED